MTLTSTHFIFPCFQIWTRSVGPLAVWSKSGVLIGCRAYRKPYHHSLFPHLQLLLLKESTSDSWLEFIETSVYKNGLSDTPIRDKTVINQAFCTDQLMGKNFFLLLKVNHREPETTHNPSFRVSTLTNYSAVFRARSTWWSLTCRGINGTKRWLYKVASVYAGLTWKSLQNRWLAREGKSAKKKHKNIATLDHRTSYERKKRSIRPRSIYQYTNIIVNPYRQSHMN